MSRADGLCLLLAIASLAVLPWLVEYWPAEEEPRRLAVASALLLGDGAGDGVIDRAQRADPTTALLIAAGRLIGIRAAGNLACSLAIAALCLAQWLLLRRAAPARWASVYLLLPLATGPLLLRGGTPILFGLALGLAAVALLEPLSRRDGVLGRRPAVVSALLFALAGLTSPLGWFLATVALLLVVGRAPLRRPAWPLAALLVAAAVPALLRGLGDLQATTSALHWMHPPLDRRVLDMLGGDLVTFSGWEELFRRVPAVVLIAAGVRAAVRRASEAPRARAARLFAGTALLALILPFAAGMPPCSSMAADYLLWTAGALCLRLPRRLPSLVTGAAGLALVAGLTLVQSRAMQEPSDRIAQVVEAGRSLPSGSRVLPLRFAAPEPRAIDPLRHAWGYVAVERAIVTPYLGGRGPLLSCASPLPRLRRRRGPASPHLGEDAPSSSQAIGPDNCLEVAEPALDCTCAPWRAIRYRALIEAARAHDRVLVLWAPAEFLAEARGALEPLLTRGEVAIFAPRRPPWPPGAGLVCPPPP